MAQNQLWVLVAHFDRPASVSILRFRGWAGAPPPRALWGGGPAPSSPLRPRPCGLERCGSCGW